MSNQFSMDMDYMIAQDPKRNHNLVSRHLNCADSFTVMHWLRCATVCSHYPQSNKLMVSGNKHRCEMPSQNALKLLYFRQNPKTIYNYYSNISGIEI